METWWDGDKENMSSFECFERMHELGARDLSCRGCA